MNLWRPLIVAVALLVGAALEIAWQAGPVPAAEEVPQLADRFFRVEWTAGASSQGQTRIIGYVYNESDHDATNVQLSDQRARRVGSHSQERDQADG